MQRTFERRSFGLANIQVRAATQDRLKFVGEAVVYDQLSDDLGGWQEVIKPGAASRTLAANPDVRFLINHNADLLLARTTSGTLSLSESESGVGVEADMADVSYARDLAVLLERGDLNQMSFGFWVVSDSWSGNLHEVREFDLDGGDVSAVTFPAFPQTSAELREAARSHLQTAWGTGQDLLGRSQAGQVPSSGPESLSGDALAAWLRSVGSQDHEALARSFEELRAGKALSEENASLVQQAIDALTSLLEKTRSVDSEAVGLELTRAQHRLREMALLAEG